MHHVSDPLLESRWGKHRFSDHSQQRYKETIKMQGVSAVTKWTQGCDHDWCFFAVLMQACTCLMQCTGWDRGGTSTAAVEWLDAIFARAWNPGNILRLRKTDAQQITIDPGGLKTNQNCAKCNYFTPEYKLSLKSSELGALESFLVQGNL